MAHMGRNHQPPGPLVPQLSTKPKGPPQQHFLYGVSPWFTVKGRNAKNKHHGETNYGNTFFFQGFMLV